MDKAAIIADIESKALRVLTPATEELDDPIQRYKLYVMFVAEDKGNGRAGRKKVRFVVLNEGSDGSGAEPAEAAYYFDSDVEQERKSETALKSYLNGLSLIRWNGLNIDEATKTATATVVEQVDASTAREYQIIIFDTDPGTPGAQLGHRELV